MLWLRLRAWWTARPGPSLNSARRRFVALDLETTGLDPRRDSVVSLAAIPFVDGVPEVGYVTLVDPERPIPPESTTIHGVTDDSVRGAPRLAGVLPEVDLVFGDHVLIGHHVGFDIAVLNRARRALALPRLVNAALDTRRLAAGLHPQWREFTLEHVAARLGIEVVARHTAEGDALTAGRIFLALLPELQARRLETVRELLWFQRHAVPL
jgi:DNA polymerase III epsilon subunit family exonuclease